MDEDRPYREAYRLERIKDGKATTVATFYSANEALTIIPSLGEVYRLMLGNKQVWPIETSFGRDEI